MDTAQWPQEIVVKPIEEIVTKPGNNNNNLERKTRPQKEALNCPRCNSTNTKFCYYNNYSLTQPRYFCKTCRRYWTEGGSLRNIPVGGGSRKNKRSSLSSSSSSKKIPHLTHPLQNPNKIQEGQDLNLAFPSTSFSELIQLPTINETDKNQISSTNSISSVSSGGQVSALELLTGISSSRGLNSFMPNNSNNNNNIQVQDLNSVYTSGFGTLQDFKPSLNFSLDGFGNGFGVQETTNGRLLFPFEDLKQVSSTSNDHIVEQSNGREQHDSTGYWTGMLGGGGGGSW